MHIPDGFLTVRTLAPTWAFSLTGLAYSLRKTRRQFEDKSVPLMGITAAFIFAAQMVNFPIGGGTSGHLLGGVLAAVLLGPWASTIVLTTVLIIQCLIFQDGGLLALGANIFNMAMVGTLVSYFGYLFLKKIFRKSMLAIGVSAWLSVVFASLFCALELAFSGISPLKIVLTAMAGIYSLIGIVEATITCLVVEFVRKARPDLIYKGRHEGAE